MDEPKKKVWFVQIPPDEDPLKTCGLCGAPLNDEGDYYENEGEEAARWLYESDGDAHDKQTALERWPWLDRMVSE